MNEDKKTSPRIFVFLEIFDRSSSWSSRVSSYGSFSVYTYAKYIKEIQDQK